MMSTATARQSSHGGTFALSRALDGAPG